MSDKLYELMDWPEIEAVVYSEEYAPREILGPHVTGDGVLNGFKVFREAYLVAGDYPQENMYLLQHLFNNWYRDLAMDKMAAAAVVTGIAIMVLVLLLQKAWEREE